MESRLFVVKSRNNQDTSAEGAKYIHLTGLPAAPCWRNRSMAMLASSRAVLLGILLGVAVISSTAFLSNDPKTCASIKSSFARFLPSEKKSRSCQSLLVWPRVTPSPVFAKANQWRVFQVARCPGGIGLLGVISNRSRNVYELNSRKKSCPRLRLVSVGSAPHHTWKDPPWSEIKFHT